MSWDVIIPFLRPIEPYLNDPSVSDILVNGGGKVFIERAGQLQPLQEVRLHEKSLQVAVRNIARVLGDEIDEEKPLLDARLPDGSRVAAVIAPCSTTGTVLAIRKFQGRFFSADELVRVGTLAPSALSILREAVESRQNILIAGGTGTGKTTLLTALSAYLPEDERIVVIEDTSEIQLAASNLLRLEARRTQPGLPAVTVRELLRAALRLRPDRIILGEIRDGDAFDLLQALNTGHSGSLSTIHANSAALAISRFTTCVLQSGIELPYRAIRSNIADALQLIAYVERRRGHRHVTEILRIDRYDPTTDQYSRQTLYQREVSE